MYNSTFSPKQRLNFIVSETKKYKILNYGSYFVLIFFWTAKLKCREKMQFCPQKP